jgi:spore coat protein CotF
MLATISRVNVAVAKQIAKKHLKSIEEKLGATTVNWTSPELLAKFKDQLDNLDREIDEVNNVYSKISYV